MKLKEVLNIELVESSIANVILTDASIFSDYYIILRDDNKTNHLSPLAEYLARELIFNKFHTFLNCKINNPHPIDWVIDTFAHVMNEIIFNYSAICIAVLKIDDDKLNKKLYESYAVPLTLDPQIITRTASYNTYDMTKDKLYIINRYIEDIIVKKLVREIVKGLILIVDI